MYVLMKEESVLDECHTKQTAEMGTAAIHRLFILLEHSLEVQVLH